MGLMPEQVLLPRLIPLHGPIVEIDVVVEHQILKDSILREQTRTFALSMVLGWRVVGRWALRRVIDQRTEMWEGEAELE